MKSMTSQCGATLLISLIMLVVLTLFVISAINLTNVNLRIAGNMQIQAETQAAAQQAIEQLITKALTATEGAEPDADIDINHDTVIDYTALLSKECVDSMISKDTDPNSLIYDSVWDIRSEVADSRTGAKTVIHQGVGVLAGGACP